MSTPAEAMEAHNAIVMRHRASRDAIHALAHSHMGTEQVEVSVQWLRDMLDQVASYEDGITWETNCTNCAKLMNANYAQYCEMERLQAVVEAQAKVVEAARAVRNSNGTEVLCMPRLGLALHKLDQVNTP